MLFPCVLGDVVSIVCLVVCSVFPDGVIMVIFLPKVEHFCSKFVAWESKEKSAFWRVDSDLRNVTFAALSASCSSAWSDESR